SVIFFTASSIVGRGEAGAYLQQSIGGRRGTPWTGHQPITGQHINNHSHIPKGNLERPINLTGMSGLWVEDGVPGENRRMHRENMQTPYRKTPGQESNPGPSCCKATVLPTAPPCSPHTTRLGFFLKTPKQFSHCPPLGGGSLQKCY
ncbi:hypothetical protein GOODEAATRI_028852, partial [Goodea atripinnis]